MVKNPYQNNWNLELSSLVSLASLWHVKKQLSYHFDLRKYPEITSFVRGLRMILAMKKKLH
jgi:hypothetical protein